MCGLRDEPKVLVTVKPQLAASVDAGSGAERDPYPDNQSLLGSNFRDKLSSGRELSLFTADFLSPDRGVPR
jgi:hypothetical protein